MMHELRSKLAALWGGFLLFVVLFLSVVHVLPVEVNVYDYQRIVEMAFIVCFFIIVREVVWPAGLLGKAAVCFFIAGALSCALSARPFWAFFEWLRIGALFAFALYIARADIDWVRFLMAGSNISTAFLCAKVIVGLLVLAQFGGGVAVLADGFSNHRHFAELLIALGSLLSFWLFRNQRSWLAVIPLFVCWVVLLLGGGRASLLAFLVGVLFFTLINGWVYKRFFVFLISGFGAWIACFFLDGSGSMRDSIEMLREGASGRGVLWFNALAYWSGRELFGLGPMHFAFYSREIAAHPHSLFLQILTEWGVVALLSGFLFALGVVIKLYRARFEYDENFSVACPVLVGLLVNSMFGGVWVVPIVELTFFFLLGIVLRSVDLGQFFLVGRWGMRAFVACFAIFVVISWFWRGLDVPRGAVLDAPRFWQDGGIPLD